LAETRISFGGWLAFCRRMEEDRSGYPQVQHKWGGDAGWNSALLEEWSVYIKVLDV
jgi:hypothetical protein